jgi:hypothetical protein
VLAGTILALQNIRLVPHDASQLSVFSFQILNLLHDLVKLAVSWITRRFLKPGFSSKECFFIPASIMINFDYLFIIPVL